MIRWQPLLAAAAVLSCPATAKKGERYRQNCAARKLCNKPFDERDPELHAAPDNAPKGHLKPLGHADFADVWAGEIDVVDDMTPETFWTKYYPRKPFILKGFGKRSPAFTKWQDDDYLLKNFGQFKAKCEPKNEDRLTDYCNQQKFGQMVRCGKDTIPYTETHMKLKKFLPKYKDPSFDKYVITQMPDAMTSDFIVPNFHSCARRHDADPGPQVAGGGRWMTQMYENNFWLSHNGGSNFSTSVVHYDMNHQIMCQFSGTKEWIMYDMKSQGKRIPMWSGYYDGKSHAASGSDDSPIDGERVDLLKWPTFGTAQWNNATLEPGDCLYTPALLLHYVRSRGRNVAGMSMFQASERYDPTCGGQTPGEPQPLSAYDTLWSFPEEDKALLGWNVIKMGFPNWKGQYLWPLADAAHKSKKGGLTRKRFLKQVLKMAREGEMNDIEDRAGAVFDSIDADKDGKVEAEALFRSRELRFLFKDMAISLEGGRGDQDEDVEVDRYDLKGDTKQRRMEL